MTETFFFHLNSQIVINNCLEMCHELYLLLNSIWKILCLLNGYMYILAAALGNLVSDVLGMWYAMFLLFFPMFQHLYSVYTLTITSILRLLIYYLETF